MFEIIDNALQFAVVLTCGIYCGVRLMRERGDHWFLLTCFYGSYLLGLVYWLLHLIFHQHTPEYFYVSELSWLASYLFLILLLRSELTKEERRYRSPLLLGIPIIFIALCLFFFQWGEYLLNVIWGGMMCVFGFTALRGLLHAEKAGNVGKRKALCIASLGLFFAEYALWVASCYWEGTALDPYFMLDVCLTFSLAAFAFVGGKEAKA